VTRSELERASHGESVVFCSVGHSVVDPVQRQLALATLYESAELLGIDPAPALQFFDVETDGERAYFERYGRRDWEHFPGDPRLMGLYVEPTNEVWIRRGLSPVDTVTTVAHEVRHAVRDDQSRELREHDADVFAEAVEAAFTN
jgi:hypothetical protein